MHNMPDATSYLAGFPLLLKPVACCKLGHGCDPFAVQFALPLRPAGAILHDYSRIQSAHTQDRPIKDTCVVGNKSCVQNCWLCMHTATNSLLQSHVNMVHAGTDPLRSCGLLLLSMIVRVEAILLGKIVSRAFWGAEPSISKGFHRQGSFSCRCCSILSSRWYSSSSRRCRRSYCRACSATGLIKRKRQHMA